MPHAITVTATNVNVCDDALEMIELFREAISQKS